MNFLTLSIQFNTALNLSLMLSSTISVNRNITHHTNITLQTCQNFRHTVLKKIQKLNFYRTTYYRNNTFPRKGLTECKQQPLSWFYYDFPNSTISIRLRKQFIHWQLRKHFSAFQWQSQLFLSLFIEHRWVYTHSKFSVTFRWYD